MIILFKQTIIIEIERARESDFKLQPMSKNTKIVNKKSFLN